MNLSWHILQKSYRILALLFGILVLSQSFLYLVSEEKEPVRIEPLSPGVVVGGIGFSDGKDRSTHRLKNLPPPDNFIHVVYTGGEESMRISRNCTDSYYAVLIFREEDDYREEPTRAKYNRAFPCPSDNKIVVALDLRSLNFAPGEYYYFIADQGAEGTWYNPR